MHKLTSLVRRVFLILRRLPDVVKIVSGDLHDKSYFRDEPRKGRLRMLADLLWWLALYGEVNQYYFAYGFDRRHGVRMHDYMAFSRFVNVRNRANGGMVIGGFRSDYRCLLRDKFVFHQYLKSLSFPTPAVFGLCDTCRGTAEAEHLLEANLSLDGQRVFIKGLLGECAGEVFAVRREGGKLLMRNREVSYRDVCESINGMFLIQEPVIQHDDLSMLYPNSVNTIRLVTVSVGNKIVPLSACQRAGAHGSEVDNMSLGGVVGRLDLETGLPDPIWYQKPGYGGRIRRHPDTGAVFEEFRPPLFREVIHFAQKLHEYFYGIHSIGWDIAIGPDGPIFIEGNDNWEISGHQMFEGGMKRAYLATLPRR